MSTLGRISGYSVRVAPLLDCWLFVVVGETRGEILSLFMAGEKGNVETCSLGPEMWT